MISLMIRMIKNDIINDKNDIEMISLMIRMIKSRYH